MATKKTSTASRSKTKARRPAKRGTLRTGEKLKPKKPVTENPFTWLPWLAVTLSNARKRARAGKAWAGEKREGYSDWSHRKGEQMAQNRDARKQRRFERRNNMKGMVECKGCNPDGTSTWHRESDVLKHIDEEHGGGAPPPSGNRSPNRTKQAAAAAAAGGAALGSEVARAARGKIDHSNLTPEQAQQMWEEWAAKNPEEAARQRRGVPQPIPGTATDDVHRDIERQNRIDKENRRRPGRHRANGKSNVMKGPWKGSVRDTGSERSKNWRSGMAGLDGVAEQMNQWASNPPETWEQSMAEAEQAADEFRGMADAFRRRAEAEVEQNNIAPECVEPYEDAANIMSQVGDHIMEVARLIKQKYGDVKEMADRGELPKEQFLNDGGAKSAAGR